MADFDLTQTDQQVQNILNDAQGAMDASAQTTLTTEYVMLKDTNGVYHKILKSSFTEAIRDVLAGLLVNNDKGTTISQIAAIASGDFGSVTPANLASVLGAFGINHQTISDVDVNTLSKTCALYLGANAQNLPSAYDGYVFLIHIQLISGTVGSAVQFCTHNIVSTKNLYFRKQLEGAWGEWFLLNFV